jgi:TetR/AcrR family transcriptional regulator, ethionamide resistance regulator
MAGKRRGKRADGEARETLLASAGRLLGDRKIVDLTVADVLADAGISRASFYFYFESKHDLVIALGEQIVGEVAQAATPWLERAELEPIDALREATRGALGVWQRHGAVLRAIAESWHASPELGDLWGGFMESFVARARAQIERERASGTAPSDGPDAAALAASLIWMNERALYLWSTGAEPAFADPETVVDTLTAIWFGAVYGSGSDRR